MCCVFGCFLSSLYCCCLLNFSGCHLVPEAKSILELAASESLHVLFLYFGMWYCYEEYCVTKYNGHELLQFWVLQVAVVLVLSSCPDMILCLTELRTSLQVHVSPCYVV